MSWWVTNERVEDVSRVKVHAETVCLHTVCTYTIKTPQYMHCTHGHAGKAFTFSTGVEGRGEI